MKKPILQALLPVALMLLLLGAASPALAGLSGTYSVGPTGNYASLTAAFADIVAQGGLSGAVIFELQPAYLSTVETFPVTAAAWTGSSATNSVTIRPASTATGLSITSANATATFRFQGATYVILDGRPGGAGLSKELTVANTNTSAVAILFIDGAQYDTLTYLKATGVNTSASSGVVLFSTSTAAGGNSYDTIDTCDLYDGATNPTNIIYSAGTAAKDNRGDIVQSSNIFNFFNATSNHVGISLGANNQDWLIQGNSFYETAARNMTGTGTLEWQAVASSSALTNNIQILNNYVGGTAPRCGGGFMTYTGNAVVRALRLTVGTSIPTSAQGNIFQNISVTSTSASSSQTMIGLVSGSFNVGTATANLIGSQVGTNSLVFALSNTSTASFAAIAAGTGTPGTINIANNLIGGISIQQIGGVGTATARGIQFQGTGGTYTISNNTIGSPSIANSFTSSTNGTISGIYSLSPSSGNIISGNLVANLAYTGTSATAQLIGIATPGSTGGSFIISGNTVRNFISTSPSTSTGTSASVIGISMTANTTSGTTVTRNVVHSLANVTATTAACVTGIHYAGTTGTNEVSRNLIHSLTLSTSGFNTLNAPQITGIYINGGTTSYLNNMVRLGFDPLGNSLTAGYPISGIYEGVGTDVFYGNSCYIGGTGVVANQPTFAFQSSVTVNARACKDNIFMNARSTTGMIAVFNYAVRYQAIDVGLASDYNDLLAPGIGGMLGGVGAGGTITNYATLPAWQLGTSRDLNSRSVDPLFVNPTGGALAGDLHIQTNIYPVSPVARAGTSLAALTNDYDNDTRAAVPCIGADEFPTYLVVATAGPHGSINPAGNLLVNAGWTLNFTIIPDPCYQVADVVVDGMSVGPVSNFVMSNISADHTIAASFTIKVLTITASAGPGGSISPSGAVPVNCGNDETFIINPDPGYTIVDVLVDGGSVGPVAIYTFVNVQANHTIEARFSGGTWVIQATAGPGGMIHPSGNVIVAAGADQPFAITPDPCYVIADVLVDGVSVGPVAGYTFYNVHADHTIQASFGLKHYIIQATAGPGGGILPSGNVIVPCGADQAFTIHPDPCYEVDDVLVDGTSVGPVAGYTFTNVQADHTIHALFRRQILTITAGAGAGGTIAPSGAVPVPCGANQDFTILPDPCYKIADVSVDGVSVGPVATYTFINVQANHTIQANFVRQTYTIVTQPSPGGTIDPSGNVIVPCGADQTFTFLPDPCYDIFDVVVDGISLGPLASYTFVNVQADHVISVGFVIKTFIITAAAGPGGAINPAGNVGVPCGADEPFTIVPDPCYDIADVVVDGASMGPVPSYTFVNVTANHTIQASFVLKVYTIQAMAGPGGNIAPAGLVPVRCGTSQSFAITPDPCYHIADVVVDGASVGPVTGYTFVNVQANHTIAASFAIDTFTLHTVVQGHGSLGIIPYQPFYDCGDSVHIAALPAPGWAFDHWEGDATGNANPLLLVMTSDKSVVAFFKDIQPPSVQVTSPNGGELWLTGTTQNITWTATDNVAVIMVDIDYSIDGGLTYPYSIAAGYPNSGSFPWPVPATESRNARVRVSAHDPAGNVGSDASDADFEIRNPLSAVAASMLPPGELAGVYPNPAPAGSTHILCRMTQAGPVDVSIFDVTGHLIRRFGSGTLTVGVHELMWDGRDAQGQTAGAGIYLVRVTAAGGKQAVKRLVLVK